MKVINGVPCAEVSDLIHPEQPNEWYYEEEDAELYLCNHRYALRVRCPEQYFEDIGLTPEEFLEKLNEGKVEVTDCDLNNLKGLQIGLKVNVK